MRTRHVRRAIEVARSNQGRERFAQIALHKFRRSGLDILPGHSYHAGLEAAMPLHERDIYYFIDVTLAHLNKITGNGIVRRDPTIEFQSLVFSAYTGLLHLKGGAEGFVYLTASQLFLESLPAPKPTRGRDSEEVCRDAITDITATIARNVHKRFGPNLQISEPRIFSTVPDDPIEMPPAVFVQPLVWRNEHAYFVLGLTSSEIS